MADTYIIPDNDVIRNFARVRPRINHYRLREHRHDKYICNIFILRFQMAPLGVSMEMQRSLCTWERIYCTRGNLKIVKKIVKLTSTENVLYASKQIMD